MYNIYIEIKAEGDLLIPMLSLLCTRGIHIQFVCIDSCSLPVQSANLKAMQASIGVYWCVSEVLHMSVLSAYSNQCMYVPGSLN